MSDDNPTPDAPEPKTDDWKAPATQEELNKIIESRLARDRAKYADYDEKAKKAAEFDKAQEASKTEIERAMERATKAEAEVAKTRMEADRNAVALAKGLTPTQAKRLVGNTREELESDADELLADLGSQATKGPRAPNQKTKQTNPKDDPETQFVRGLFGKVD